MKILLADTGPLYAAFDSGDQFHQRALQEITKINAQGFSVQLTYPTLSEAYSLVMYRFSPAKALDFLEQLKQTTGFLSPLTEDYKQAFALLIRFGDQRLSLFDAVLHCVSQRLNHPVWTYDFHFDLMQAQVCKLED